MRSSFLLAALLAVAGQLQAGVIYQQGDTTGPSSGSNSYESVFGLDDFTIGEDAIVESIDWWVLAVDVPSITNADWQFRSVVNGNQIGDIVADGSATPTSIITSDQFGALDIFKFSIDITDTPLTAGSYFFGLRVDTETDVAAFWSVDFDQARNLTAALREDGSFYAGDRAELQFQFNGSTTVIPEPSSLVIFGVSVAGMCGFRRRRLDPLA